MILKKQPFITRINSVDCELPLSGGWGVLHLQVQESMERIYKNFSILSLNHT